jgi:hypothetical protein
MKQVEMALKRALKHLDAALNENREEFIYEETSLARDAVRSAYVMIGGLKSEQQTEAPKT